MFYSSGLRPICITHWSRTVEIILRKVSSFLLHSFPITFVFMFCSHSPPSSFFPLSYTKWDKDCSQQNITEEKQWRITVVTIYFVCSCELDSTQKQWLAVTPLWYDVSPVVWNKPLIYINDCPTRCNTKQSIYYSASSLYMFRVSTTPIIRSKQNCKPLIYINNCPTRWNTKQSIYYSASSLYMFRVSTTPIIRSK